MINKLFKYKYSIIILLFAFSAFKCSSGKITDISGEETELKVNVSPAVSVDLSQDYTFILTITGPGILKPIKETLIPENGILNCKVIVPAGPKRIFSIEGFDETGKLIYSGLTAADIDPDVTTVLQIDLNPRVPMIKLSPPRYDEPIGSSLLYKVNVYNLNALSSIEIHIENYCAKLGRGILADNVILNPGTEDLNSLNWWINEDSSATIQVNSLHEGSIVDESGYGELAVVYYKTDSIVNASYSLDYDFEFSPQITAMAGLDGDTINTSNIYTRNAAANLVFDFFEHSVGYWKMDWLSENTDRVYDSWNNLDGTAFGTYLAEGKYGDARGFDGMESFIEVPDNDLLDITEGITFAFWINIPEYSNIDPAVIFNKMSTEGSVNYQLYVSGIASDEICTFLFSYGGFSSMEDGHFYLALIPENIVGTGWHHVVFSCQFGDPSSAIFFFDGNEAYGEWLDFAGSSLPPITDGPLIFGKLNGSDYPFYFKGELDDFQLYNTSFNKAGIIDAFIHYIY